MIDKFKKVIKYEVKDDILYFSANGIYRATISSGFETNSNSMSGNMIDKNKDIFDELEDGEILTGRKYGFTYVLTYKNALKFLDRLTSDKVVKGTIKGYLDAINDEVKEEISKSIEQLRREIRVLREENDSLKRRLSTIRDVVMEENLNL